MLRGTTPITITDVAVHRGCRYDSTGQWLSWLGELETYDIKLTKMGYRDYTLSGIQVAAGETTSVHATLTPVSAIKTPTNVPTAIPTPSPRILPDSLPSKEHLIDSYIPKPYNNVGNPNIPIVGGV
jgi:hypothetical protein